jgi:hypothetical protein
MYFTSTYSDPDGHANLANVRFLINSSLTSQGGAYFVYSQNTNKFYMGDNASTLIPSTGVVRGSDYTIESPHAILHCKASTVVMNGNTLTVTWCVRLKPSMTGKPLNLYLKAIDDSNAYAGWTLKGTTTCSFTNIAPSTVSATLSAGTVPHSTWTTISAVCADPNTRQDLSVVRLLVNTSLTSVGGAHFLYSQNTNKLYMVNNSFQQIPAAGIVAGTPGVIETENAYLDCQNTTVEPATFGAVPLALGSGNLKVNFRVMFKPGMAGKVHNVYLRADDDHGASSSWVNRGTLTVGNLVDAVRVTPQGITMIRGTTYDLVRAHALDGDGKVIPAATFSWQSNNTGVVTVADQGFDASQEYRRARLSAVEAGTAIVTVSAGGRSSQINVTIVNNPTDPNYQFRAIQVNTTGIRNVPVAQGLYKHFYFYARPGLEHRVVVVNLTGHEDVEVARDPGFTSIIDSGDTYWNDLYTFDTVCAAGYGAYFVRVRGAESVNNFDIRVLSPCSPYIYPALDSVSDVQPNGQILYPVSGDGEQRVFAFPAKAATKYWVEVDAVKGHLDVVVARDRGFTSIIDSGDTYWDDRYNKEISGPVADSKYYVRITGAEYSNFYWLRITTTNASIGGYQVHGTPRRILLPPGTRTTVLADCLGLSGNIVTGSAWFDWVSENPGLVAVASGGLDPSGYFRQAAIQAAASVSGAQDTVIRSTAQGIPDRIAVRVVDLAALWGNAAHLIPNGGAVGGTVAADDFRLYWFLTQPGTEYVIAVSNVQGHEDVWVYGDEFAQDEIDSGDTYWGAYTYRFVASPYCGTLLVKVVGTESANDFTISVESVPTSDRYFPRGAVVPLTVNAAPVKARLSGYGRGAVVPLTVSAAPVKAGLSIYGDGPVSDIFSFTTAQQDKVYTIRVAAVGDESHLDVRVTYDRAGNDEIDTGDTYWGQYEYAFTAPQAGRKYYIHVTGANAANHYEISVSQQ